MPLLSEPYSGKKSAFVVKTCSDGRSDDESSVALILSAESVKHAQEWMETMNNISRRLQEQSFFPDDLMYDYHPGMFDDMSVRLKAKSYVSAYHIHLSLVCHV